MTMAPNINAILATLGLALTVRIFALPGPTIVDQTYPQNDNSKKNEDKDEENHGKIVPVTLQWRKITCTLSDRMGKSMRFLLTNINGEAKAGRLLAIMGPSGSGKTTLLNVLAGQLAASPRLRLMGRLYVNGSPFSLASYKIAYVRQEDLFFSQLTVRETLSLAAELQLSKLSTPEDVGCADCIVGDAKVRGISGGEKKRLSVACELIASPSVIFADEPTTGLDAFQAERVMETLRQLAQEGHIVVCSIHQPRGSIYAKFDDLILLSEGAVVYAGPAQEEPLSYFVERGFICQEHVNPAEFFTDLIFINYSLSESEHLSRKLIDHLVEATRNGPTNKVRARMSVASALIFGSIFWRMGLSQTSIQDRMGLLQVAAINTAMAALTKTVGVFPKERAIVDRERAKGCYALGPYLFAKLLAEIPVGAAFPSVESFAASAMGLTVGAMVPTSEAAMALGPSLMTIFIVFGGYYVNSENTPAIFRWIPRISLIRWAFQALCINEFKGLKFDQQHSFDLETGEQVLERLSFTGSTIGDALAQEGRILLFWYWMTYVLLKKNKPRYQPLELSQLEPNSSEVGRSENLS